MRKIIIGDVHGCYDQLVELLEKIKFNIETDILYMVGDLMDRGPKSVEVFDYVSAMKKRIGNKLLIARGNHEVMGMNRFGKEQGYWNGGDKTDEQFEKVGRSFQDIVPWLKENTSLYYIDEDFQICHAGVNDEIELCSSDILIWDRDAFLYAEYDGKLTVVGHTPLNYPALSLFPKTVVSYEYRKEYDLPEKGLLDIDTGCVFNGRLTAMIVEDKKMKFEYVDGYNDKK